VTPQQAQRLAMALRGLLVGLRQGVILGMTGSDSEQYFAATARALITPGSTRSARPRSGAPCPP
jgi:hypothetical protein